MTEPPGPDERARADEDGLVVPSAPRSVALARRYAVDACTALGWGRSGEAVSLLVSELATNAVLHSYGDQVRIRVAAAGARLRVEVLDDSPVLPLPRRASAGAENGRGLALVEALADHWGVDAHPGGKVTWFELDR